MAFDYMIIYLNYMNTFWKWFTFKVRLKQGKQLVMMKQRSRSIVAED